MTGYVKAVSKRSEIEGKEKTLPIAYLGGTMISHGEDFDPDSEYGQCLTSELSPDGIPIQLLTLQSIWTDAREVGSCTRDIHISCYNILA